MYTCHFKYSKKSKYFYPCATLTTWHTCHTCPITHMHPRTVFTVLHKHTTSGKINSTKSPTRVRTRYLNFSLIASNHSTTQHILATTKNFMICIPYRPAPNHGKTPFPPIIDHAEHDKHGLRVHTRRDHGELWKCERHTSTERASIDRLNLLQLSETPKQRTSRVEVRSTSSVKERAELLNIYIDILRQNYLSYTISAAHFRCHFAIVTMVYR